MSQDTDVLELAAAQAADNLHPWETRVTWTQGQDGLPHPSGVEGKRK